MRGGTGVASGSIIDSRPVERGVRDPAARFLWIQPGVAVYAGLSLALVVGALVVGALGHIDALSDLWTHFQRQEGLPFRASLHGSTPDAVLFVEEAAGVSLMRNSRTDDAEQLVMAGGLGA